jgi:hypothetical protein
MLSRRRFWLAAILGGVALLGATSPARADFELMLSDTADGASVTIHDNGIGDLNPLAGVITFSGTVGEFAINVTTGESKPVLGSPTQAKMDLNSVDTKLIGSKADTLTIKLSDTDFGPTAAGTLKQEVGGTFSGSVTSASFTSYKDPSNTDFGMGGTATPTLTFTTSPFSGSSAASHPAYTVYSMTQVATIVASGGAGNISFDLETTNFVPEPSSMALAGLGALCLIGYGLRRRKAQGA